LALPAPESFLFSQLWYNDLMPVIHRSQLIFLFLIFLVVPQAIQFTRQFSKGFIPFKKDPQPTYLSWDMFANPVERCLLEWNAPLNFPHHSGVTSTLALTPKLEWGITYNHVSDYQWVQHWLCEVGKHQGVLNLKSHLDCFLPQGTEFNDELDCSKI
jgi:hypothetical protein